MKKKIKNLLNAILIMLCISSSTVYAADDPLKVINNFSSLITSLIHGIGGIVLVFGALQFGLSIKAHDPSQRDNSILTMLGGVIVYFAPEIIDLILK